MTLHDLRNTAQPGVPFYTPAQKPAAGTAIDAASAPSLFKPLRIRSLELHNRFVVSPMCQYSSDNGHLTDWHVAHLGQFALHGAGLVFVEATATEARGRISIEDSGLWQDSQIEPLRRVVDYIHGQNSKIGIQIGHAGRKASTLAPWIGGSVKKTMADEAIGGWPNDVVGASAIPWDEDHAVPKELSVEEIQGLVKGFADSATRAVKAGVDVIEIHGAHGYLVSSFLSPISNQRTDDYGGSFENRTRFLREIIAAVRAVIPETMPLWLRVSATEWVEYLGQPSWDLESTIKLAKLLPGLGVDLLDVSSGGNNAAQKFPREQTFQTNLAKAVRRAVRADNLDLLVGAVGRINTPEFARDVVQDGEEQSADVAIAASQFLREPNFVLKAAAQLGVPVKYANQYFAVAPRS